MRLVLYRVADTVAQAAFAEAKRHDRHAQLRAHLPGQSTLAFEAPTAVHRELERTYSLLVVEDLS